MAHDSDRLGLKLPCISQGDPKGLAHAIRLSNEFLGDILLKGVISKRVSASHGGLAHEKDLD